MAKKMASLRLPIPETRVLAIASHVVYGYVGNTMATFVMQALGCNVAAINTVHFSNHTGYGQFKGTKISGQEIRDLYQGLGQSYLTDFDVLLSGYAGSAEAVQAVGEIARDLKAKATSKPGSFFWVLDPVMGDEGKLYVSEDIVPAYKGLLGDADLILPNQFEAELLSGVTIHSLSTLSRAISTLHETYKIPHIIITSVQLDRNKNRTSSTSKNDDNNNDSNNDTLTIIGSTARSDYTARCFRIDVPTLPCFFSGTGDMFAALMVVRMREQQQQQQQQREQQQEADLQADPSATRIALTDWRLLNVSDGIAATDLPLARATERVLASMQTVLEKTVAARDAELAGASAASVSATASDAGQSEDKESKAKRYRLAATKAAEVRVVRNVADLWHYPTDKFCASLVDLDEDVEEMGWKDHKEAGRGGERAGQMGTMNRRK